VIPAVAGGDRFVGRSVPRREDPRLLTGRGQFVADVAVPHALHVAFLRSEVARAVITAFDTAAAVALPGVRAVLTAGDLNPGVGRLDPTIYLAGGSLTPSRPLADRDVRFVGDPIALVVADTRATAEDALEAVEVHLDVLPPVLDIEGALDDDAAAVHTEVATNLAASSLIETPGFAAAFAAAPRVFDETFRIARQSCAPLETGGLVASWAAAQGRLTVWISSQDPHEARATIARVLDLDPALVRVVQHDVGGGFGQKVYLRREHLCVCLAARHLGATLRWTEDRRENLLAAGSARGERLTVRLATEEDGRIVAADLDYLEGVGAYPVILPGSVAGAIAMAFAAGYRIPHVRLRSRSVWTNSAGKVPFRGPWAIETIAREQMLDGMAQRLGLDPVELRRRNIVRTSDQPHATPVGLLVEGVTAEQTLDAAAERFDLSTFRAAQEQGRRSGRYLGVGVATFVEPSGFAGPAFGGDSVHVSIALDGTVTAALGSGCSGMSVETTVAQVVADRLGVELQTVTVVQGDTAVTPFGHGTAGSRTAVVQAGAAEAAADTLRDKIRRIGAHLLEAAIEDIVIEAGQVLVRGTPSRALPLRSVAEAAYLHPDRLPPGEAGGLRADGLYHGPPVTFSNACHICGCEVDPTSGLVRLTRYVVAEDCGRMINPMVVEGQISGGVAQGIGTALYEELGYDADGNPTTSTLMDYLLPTVHEVPPIEYIHVESPTPGSGAYKGLGEGGAICSPPAVANAVMDALRPFGVRTTTLPITPLDIARLLYEAGR
jgi:carbon-monoxide dehydrogenase large subunit